MRPPPAAAEPAWYADLALLPVDATEENLQSRIRGTIMMALVFFSMIFVDNNFARMKWQPAVRSAWGVTLVLSAVNIILLVLWK